MIIRSDFFMELNGFDENYFMYYEDVDLCMRAHISGGKVLAVPSIAITHDARRASRKNFQHFRWHFMSLLRYLWKYSGI
jgi:N-acetylglucosaminyl-diphospho-decaprenol L-rhamnosyltransferase